MKNSIYHLSSLLALSCLLLACGNKDKTENQQMNESLKNEKEMSPEIVFENDYAKVVKVTLAPAAALEAHQGEDRVIYSLSDYTVDWVEQGKNTSTKSWNQGDVHFHKAGQHSGKNTGNSTAEWLAFIKKNANLPDCNENTLENDVHSVVPDLATLSFDNEAFRVTEVRVPQGVSIPMHAGANRIIYSLSDYQLLYESVEAGKKEGSFKKGDVHWHNACQHTLKNIGETEAKFLVISYKK